MKCPVCNVNLVMSERQGVEIDYCPECRGVWLDRGELDKIIERSDGGGSSGNQEDNDRSKNRDDDDDEGFSQSGNQKKKGGFLSNLMDFGGD